MFVRFYVGVCLFLESVRNAIERIPRVEISCSNVRIANGKLNMKFIYNSAQIRLGQWWIQQGFLGVLCEQPSTKQVNQAERQVDGEKRKVFVAAHVVLRTAAMFLASALNRGGHPAGNIKIDH